MAIYTVVVGNIGTVYNGEDEQKARYTYAKYRVLIHQRTGRCAGESVCWFEGEKIVAESYGR